MTKFKITNRKFSGKTYYKSICSTCVSAGAQMGRELRKLHPPPEDMTCNCCGRFSRLVIDHCHASGRFRGYVCQQCNVGLGNLGDNEDGLLQAISYLHQR